VVEVKNMTEAASTSATAAQEPDSFKFSVSGRRFRPTMLAEMFEQADKLNELESVFGFLIESPLNGGRVRAGSLNYPPEEIERLNDMGVGYSFTLTNLAAAPEHLNDSWTNEMLKRFEKPINSVTVATELVENFVRERYPGYRLRASCMYDFKTIDEINEATERFDMVTCWPEINDKSDEDLLRLIHKDRVMLFGAQVCLKRCGDHRLRHFYVSSLDHIAWYNQHEYGVPYHPGSSRWIFKSPCQGKNAGVELEDLERLKRLGFSRIKITPPLQFAEAYLGVKWSMTRKILTSLRGKLEFMPGVRNWTERF